MANNEQYCDNGKVMYSTKAEASPQISSLSKRNRKHKFSVYKCEICGCFHIVTVTKQVRKYKRK